MHECGTRGTACNCAGDDLWLPEPVDRQCINPECDGSVDGFGLWWEGDN